MKIRNLLLSGILGILAAGTAGAQTTVYISGAPAVRAYVSQAIADVLTSSTSGAITWAYSNGTTTATEANALAKANALIFYGGNVLVNGSNVPITVSVTYVGSSSGIQDVASSSQANFLSIGDTAAGSANGGYPDPTASGAAHQDVEYPLFTASDEFQQSTPWYGTNTLTGTTATYVQLQSDVAGIIPYRFVASPDAPSYLTNISVQQAKQLWQSGFVWLNNLTGTSSDSSTAVYALGRNPGSGLRTVLLSETGIGVETSVKQFQPTVTGTGGGSQPYVATKQVIWPADNVNGVAIGVGDSGYSSFSAETSAVEAYTTSHSGSIIGNGYANDPAVGATGGIYVTALADSDAQTAIKGGAHELSYNGFYLAGAPYTGTGSTGLLQSGSASTALANGQYTFWSYIQLQYQPGLATATLSNTLGSNLQQQAAYAFEQLLYTKLRNTDAAVLLNTVNVNRSSDGGTITNGQPY